MPLFPRQRTTNSMSSLRKRESGSTNTAFLPLDAPPKQGLCSPGCPIGVGHDGRGAMSSLRKRGSRINYSGFLSTLTHCKNSVLLTQIAHIRARRGGESTSLKIQHKKGCRLSTGSTPFKTTKKLVFFRCFLCGLFGFGQCRAQNIT